MSSFVPKIPAAKPPSLALPQIRLPIHIPKVGCPGAESTHYIGAQFGNQPDLYDALHLKHLKKVTNDQIYALLKGELPTILRAGLYAQKAAELIQDVTDFLSTLNQIIGAALAEYQAAASFVQGKISELNVSLAALQALPAVSLTATQRLAMQRYHEYIGELNQQVSRIQTSISCLVE